MYFLIFCRSRFGKAVDSIRLQFNIQVEVSFQKFVDVNFLPKTGLFVSFFIILFSI